MAVAAATGAPTSPRPMSVGTALRHIGGYVLPYRGRAAFLVTTLVLEVAYETSLPLTLRYVIDRVVAPRDWHVLGIVVVALACGYVVTTAAMLACDYH